MYKSIIKKKDKKERNFYSISMIVINAKYRILLRNFMLKINKIMSFYFSIKTRYRSLSFSAVDSNTARSAISLVYPKFCRNMKNDCMQAYTRFQ